MKLAEFKKAKEQIDEDFLNHKISQRVFTSRRKKLLDKILMGELEDD